MDVEYNHKIDEKVKLVKLILHQKRVAEAASTTQRIFRAKSSSTLLHGGLNRSRSRLLAEGEGPVDLE